MRQLTDQEIAHLGMVQTIISRMASNSFALKALSVTITTAIIALASSQNQTSDHHSYAGLLPIIVFWIMDAKYLRLERLYRKLYDHIRIGEEFPQLSMNTSKFDKNISSTIRIAFSWSVIWFYLAIAIALLAVLSMQTIFNIGV